jgi:hypothetical protein
MSSASRAVAAWLTIAGLGLAAAFVLLSQRYSASTPRWDLIGCFAVAAVGVSGCLVTVRGRTFTDAFSGVGPRPWWPDVRALWKGLFPLAWFMVLMYFVSGVTHVSPTAQRMVEDGHVIAPVKVSEVLSSEREGRDRVSRYYSVRVRASVPYAAGDASRTVEFDSERRVNPGDKVWALYAPSAPELGVFLEEDRTELEEKAGGPDSGVPFALAILLALLVAALWYTAPGLPRHLRRALREGRVRRIPVRATGGTATLAESPSAKDYNKSGPNDKPELKPSPCLLLLSPANERIQAVVGKAIDPVGIASVLEDRQNHSPAALYWIASGRDEAKGVLVSGSYYLHCQKVVEGEGDTVPASGEVAENVGDARRRPRAVLRFPEWRADLHTDGFGWTLFVLLLLGVIALGVGLIASIVLGVIAFLAELIVLYGASAERSEELEKLMPDSRPEDPGRNPSGSSPVA